jgi:hypothetical protein
MRIVLALALMIAAPAFADESLPLLYTRADVTLVRQSMPPLPWGPSETSSSAELVLDTEIRDGATLYNQSGWINLASPESTHAIMLVFGAPVLAPIASSQNYASLDFLLLNRQGTITQIFPKLRLSSLQEEIYPAEPLSAFLLLRGGTCENYSIKPGDYVLYSLFKRPPKMMSAPEKQP